MSTPDLLLSNPRHFLAIAMLINPKTPRATAPAVANRFPPTTNINPAIIINMIPTISRDRLRAVPFMPAFPITNEA